LGAQRIPDPTTSGDFTRRFDQDSVLAPLIILANTREVLYMVNRPGNVVSHEGCVPWIDRAIELVRPHADEITLRGGTDFTLSAELDRWDGQGIKFIFVMDAHPKVVELAEALLREAWKPLERLARYEIATEPRRKPQRIKEAIVRFKGYMNKKLVGEMSRSSIISHTSAGAGIGWWWCAKHQRPEREQVLFNNSRDSFRSSCQPWLYPKPTVSRRNEYRRSRWT
jgi:hypothetical protein